MSYPKYLYSKDGARLVHSADEEKALKGFAESPADVGLVAYLDADEIGPQDMKFKKLVQEEKAKAAKARKQIEE